MSIYFSNCSIQVIIFFQRAVEFGSTVTLIVTLLSPAIHLFKVVYNCHIEEKYLI